MTKPQPDRLPTTLQSFANCQVTGIEKYIDRAGRQNDGQKDWFHVEVWKVMDSIAQG
jgi:hypothetical protein